MCVDQEGLIFGYPTGNGLNMFNGKTVDKYFVNEYPQLHSNNIIHVTCDSRQPHLDIDGGRAREHA